MNVRKSKIQDVAKLAGVSLSTVSAVLNSKNIVRDETRDRILAAIAELKYHPTLYASNLARRQTYVFGMIISDIVNPFFGEIARAIEQEAAKRGYQVALAETAFDPEKLRQAVLQMLAMRVAGLAVMTSESDHEVNLLIRASGIPAIFLDTGKPDGSISNLRVDSGHGMSLAVQHLIELGHTDILFVKNSPAKGQLPLLSHQLRQRGFSAAVRKFGSIGLRTTMLDVPGSGAEAGFMAMRNGFSKPMTAVMAITDVVAMGVYRGLQEAGLRIPADVSVVGFDNSYLGQYLNPPLTTVDIPREPLAKLVVETLLASIEGRQQGRELLLRTQLNVRSSTATPRLPARRTKLLT